MFETDDYFSDVLLRPVFSQSSEILDKCTAISSVEILHDEVKVIFRLESVVKFDDKIRFSGTHEDHSFCFDIRDLVLRNHIRFLEHFDRVIIPSRDLFREINGTNCRAIEEQQSV